MYPLKLQSLRQHLRSYLSTLRPTAAKDGGNFYVNYWNRFSIAVFSFRSEFHFPDIGWLSMRCVTIFEYIVMVIEMSFDNMVI